MSDTDDILLRRLKEGIEAGEPVKAAGSARHEIIDGLPRRADPRSESPR